MGRCNGKYKLYEILRRAELISVFSTESVNENININEKKISLF
jgi:hypothetical protein